jgi:hypothetical protein
VPQETHDQLRCDAELRVGVAHPLQQTIDGDREGQPTIRMGLGIEEDFRVHAAIGMQSLEIRHRQRLEVLLRLQHVRALIVDIEKVLQVREGVRRPHFLDALERNIDLVALPQLKHQLRLQRTLDVQMQLRLGNAANEGFGYGHGRLPIWQTD